MHDDIDSENSFEPAQRSARETFLPIAIAAWLILRDGRWPWLTRPIPAAIAPGAR